MLKEIFRITGTGETQFGSHTSINPKSVSGWDIWVELRVEAA